MAGAAPNKAENDSLRVMLPSFSQVLPYEQSRGVSLVTLWHALSCAQPNPYDSRPRVSTDGAMLVWVPAYRVAAPIDRGEGSGGNSPVPPYAVRMSGIPSPLARRSERHHQQDVREPSTLGC
jgi:hypothetical protein